MLAVGDKVDITGAEKVEFALTADTSGRTTTELQPVSGGAMTVTKVGTGTVPAAHVIDAAVLTNMDEATRYAEYEKWEGVLTRVENVSVVGGIAQIGGAMPDPTFREFVVTGGLHVDLSLANIPSVNDGGGATDLVHTGDCLASVTGMGDYFFSYKILPRATNDIALNGTGCPAPQSPPISDIQSGTITAGTGEPGQRGRHGDRVQQQEPLGGGRRPGRAQQQHLRLPGLGCGGVAGGGRRRCTRERQRHCRRVQRQRWR